MILGHPCFNRQRALLDHLDTRENELNHTPEGGYEPTECLTVAVHLPFVL